MTAEARFITPPTPSRPNLLAPAQRIAEMLGVTLMPWQEQVIGTLTERYPDGTPVYTDATVTTSRQAGKTRTITVLALLQALSAPDQKIAYTSTTGSAARAVLMDELVPSLRASRFDGLFTVRATNGAERVLFTNGSSISLLSSAKHAGHGATLNMVLCDELWNAEDWLEQIRPTLITTGGVWYGFSTAGTPTDSEYLLHRVERGRADVQAGVTSGRFYAEWSIDPADIGDVESYVRCNPAVGYTVKADDIRAAVAGMDKSEAARAYGNAWTTALHDPVISLETWHALEDNGSEIESGLVLAIDVSPSRDHASIAAAGRRADGRWHVEVVDSRRGVSWLPDRLAEIVRKQSPIAVYADAMSASLLPDLENIGVNVEQVNTAAHAAAHAFFVEQVLDDQVRHPEDTELVQALTAATVRPLGDGGSAWSRRSSNTNIDPLVAVTIALHGAHTSTGIIGFWSLDKVIADMRSTSWDLNETAAFHRLLDGRADDQAVRMLKARGFAEPTARDIVAFVVHGVQPDVQAETWVLPQSRQWQGITLNPQQMPVEASPVRQRAPAVVE
jgi:phage terminase large subunit-like protein